MHRVKFINYKYFIHVWGESEYEVNGYLPFHAAFLTKPGSGMVGNRLSRQVHQEEWTQKEENDPICI